MGFFDLFKKKELCAPEVERSGAQFAFVLLDGPAPAAEQVLALMGKYTSTPEKFMVSEEGEGEDGVLSFNVAGLGIVLAALIPSPVPDREAEAMQSFSFSSFNTDAQDIAPHRSHLMVTMMDQELIDKPVEAMTSFTALMAAVLEASGGLGVYWGNVGATHPAAFFLSLASEQKVSSYLLLWTGISRASEPEGGMSLLSMGLTQLGVANLHMIADHSKVDTLLERFLDLALYVVERGSSIPNGDTVGVSAEELLPVRYVKSPAGSDEVVAQIRL